jgi:hypothetical protein
VHNPSGFVARLVAGLVFATGTGGAQSFSLGIKGGVLLTDPLGSYGVHSESKRYAVGPTVEIGLPRSLAFEVDALYQRTGFSTAESAARVTYLTRMRANTWEFPLLVKHYFSRSDLPARPYVSGGFVVRNLSGAKYAFHQFGTDRHTGEPVDLAGLGDYVFDQNPTYGVVIGGGLRLKAGLVRIAPEVRYTRWTSRPIDVLGSRGFLEQSGQNQVDLLVGVTF